MYIKDSLSAPLSLPYCELNVLIIVTIIIEYNIKAVEEMGGCTLNMVT
jgi:hypothetical protein